VMRLGRLNRATSYFEWLSRMRRQEAGPKVTDTA
jgi:hypothetical protein